MWIVRHWLLLANAFLLTFAGLAALQPLLRAGGFSGSADVIWAGYGFVCHQLPDRSYFVAGQQMAFCERDTAIYGSMALAGLLWMRFRRSVPRLSWSGFLLLAVPMALDGFSQALGLRESTWQLRTLTGALFGLGCVWFGYPLFERTAKLIRIARRAAVLA
jgi:uncharacterized membrane protein